MCNSVTFIIIGWQSFSPFREKIDNNYDVLMDIYICWVTSHEIDSPLAKGFNHDNWGKGSLWSSHFGREYLTFHTPINKMDAMVEYRRRIISCMDNFLSIVILDKLSLHAPLWYPFRTCFTFTWVRHKCKTISTHQGNF